MLKLSTDDVPTRPIRVPIFRAPRSAPIEPAPSHLTIEISMVERLIIALDDTEEINSQRDP